MHRKTRVALVVICTLLLTACSPSAPQLAATYVAETMSAAPTSLPPTFTPLPSDTPLPTNTLTPTPSDTPTVTITHTPTNTPTITRTPGPFSFFDDFTSDSGEWENCDLCQWKDGALVMGPYEPAAILHKNYCTGCGSHTYYKIAVDATFVDGQVDRFFGVFVGDANGKQYYFGISPWQFYVILQHTDEGEKWEPMDFQWSGSVNASYATNHIEVAVKPAFQPNTGDYLFSLNGTTLYIIYGVPVSPSRTGLAMDYHAMTASYDNWEYVEIEK